MQLVVGRIAKAHGIGGEVVVEVRTDSPDHRFAVGTAVDTEPTDRGPLRVERTRWHSGRLLVRFADVSDRTTAEALRGTLLVADSTTSPGVADAEEFWDHDLLGLLAVVGDGSPLGEVTDVLHPPGTDLLVVRRRSGEEVLVPFVRSIVPQVDLTGRRLLVEPPEGLLEL
jgi:16S rRNA processing protein RimM